MKKLTGALILGTLWALSGCGSNPIYGDEGFIKDHAQDYEQAKSLPKMKVPEHLDGSAVKQLMVIPAVDETASKGEEAFEVPRPNFFYAEAGNDVVNMARDDREKFIMVNQPLNEVWGMLGDFWRYNSFTLAISDPVRGVMETQWITYDNAKKGFFSSLFGFGDDEKDYKDKLRMELSATDDNRTAIRLQHMRMSLDPDAEEPRWSSNSAQDADYRTDMLYSLLNYLSKTTNASTALAYQARQERDKVRGLLGRDADGQPVLKLTTSIQQGWRWVEQAMTAAAMDVGSSNSDLGKFYITYTSSIPVEEGGTGLWDYIKSLHSNDSDAQPITFSTDFLSKSLGIDPDDDPSKKIRYSAKEKEETGEEDLSQVDGYKIWVGDQVLYVFRSDDASELNEETGQLEYTGFYQIYLDRRRTGVFVSVLTEEATPANARVAEEILWGIKDHLPEG